MKKSILRKIIRKIIKEQDGLSQNSDPAYAFAASSEYEDSQMVSNNLSIEWAPSWMGYNGPNITVPSFNYNYSSGTICSEKSYLIEGLAVGDSMQAIVNYILQENIPLDTPFEDIMYVSSGGGGQGLIAGYQEQGLPVDFCHVPGNPGIKYKYIRSRHMLVNGVNIPNRTTLQSIFDALLNYGGVSQEEIDQIASYNDMEAILDSLAFMCQSGTCGGSCVCECMEEDGCGIDFIPSSGLIDDPTFFASCTNLADVLFSNGYNQASIDTVCSLCQNLDGYEYLDSGESGQVSPQNEAIIQFCNGGCCEEDLSNNYTIPTTNNDEDEEEDDSNIISDVADCNNPTIQFFVNNVAGFCTGPSCASSNPHNACQCCPEIEPEIEPESENECQNIQPSLINAYCNGFSNQDAFSSEQVQNVYNAILNSNPNIEQCCDFGPQGMALPDAETVGKKLGINLTPKTQDDPQVARMKKLAGFPEKPQK